MAYFSCCSKTSYPELPRPARQHRWLPYNPKLLTFSSSKISNQPDWKPNTVSGKCWRPPWYTWWSLRNLLLKESSFKGDLSRLVYRIVFFFDKFFFNKQFIHLVPPQPMLKRIKLSRWNEIQRESKGKMPSLIFRRGTKRTSLTITFCSTLKNHTSLARENIALSQHSWTKALIQEWMFLDPCLYNNKKAVDRQEGQTEYIVNYKLSDGIKNQVKFWKFFET